MKPNSPWIAAIFCAFICVFMMVGQIMESASQNGHPFAPAFYSFLPMCFVYVGILMKQMQQEIQDLRKQVAAKQPAAPDGSC
ncbi:hypothetical protein GC163_14540 [bacterium]|nr:hypothetical protein [bacterium]